jgi:hypothetical protein
MEVKYAYFYVIKAKGLDALARSHVILSDSRL